MKKEGKSFVEIIIRKKKVHESDLRAGTPGLPSYTVTTL
jgi:hypothetical protein